MKTIGTTVFFIFFCFYSFGQKINLQQIINKAYASIANTGFINKDLCYIIPQEIKIIDTSNALKYKFNIKYFKSTGNFQTYLQKIKKAQDLRIKLNEISNSEIIITISLSEVDIQNYNENFKLLKYLDDRIVSLKYDKKSKKWIFKRLIRDLGDFTPN